MQTAFASGQLRSVAKGGLIKSAKTCTNNIVSGRVRNKISVDIMIKIACVAHTSLVVWSATEDCIASRKGARLVGINDRNVHSAYGREAGGWC